jgi:hypothetical protein
MQISLDNCKDLIYKITYEYGFLNQNNTEFSTFTPDSRCGRTAASYLFDISRWTYNSDI